MCCGSRSVLNVACTAWLDGIDDADGVRQAVRHVHTREVAGDRRLAAVRVRSRCTRWPDRRRVASRDSRSRRGCRARPGGRPNRSTQLPPAAEPDRRSRPKTRTATPTTITAATATTSRWRRMVVHVARNMRERGPASDADRNRRADDDGDGGAGQHLAEVGPRHHGGLRRWIEHAGQHADQHVADHPRQPETGDDPCDRDERRLGPNEATDLPSGRTQRGGDRERQPAFGQSERAARVRWRRR